MNDLWLLEGSALKLDCIYTRPKDVNPQTFDFYFNGVLVENDKNGFQVCTCRFSFVTRYFAYQVTEVEDESSSSEFCNQVSLKQIYLASNYIERYTVLVAKIKKAYTIFSPIRPPLP